MESPISNWLVILSVTGAFLLWGAGTVWAAKYRGMYSNPYLLRSATRKDILLWSMRYAIIQFGAYSGFGVIFLATLLTIQTELSTRFMFWANCLGGLIFIFAIVVAVAYVTTENTLSNYLRWDKDKKQGFLTRHGLFRYSGLMNAEMKEHFWKYGYSEDITIEDIDNRC